MKGQEATLKCNFCGKVFKKKIGPNTYEIKCPKCKEYDVDVISNPRNPGAAYHKEEAKRWMEMFRQTGDDEYRRKVISEENHVIMSKAKNIPNPIHRSVKRSFPVLGLLVIGGIIWWLVKRNQTV